MQEYSVRAKYASNFQDIVLLVSVPDIFARLLWGVAVDSFFFNIVQSEALDHLVFLHLAFFNCTFSTMNAEVKWWVNFAADSLAILGFLFVLFSLPAPHVEVYLNDPADNINEFFVSLSIYVHYHNIS